MAEVASTEPRLLRPLEARRPLSPERKAAWVGLLRLHADTTRAVDRELVRRHRIGLRSYAVLDALADAENGHLRMTSLADQAQLSVSRASRLVDELEGAGLVARTACAGDSRVVHVRVTDAGCRLLSEAQDTFLEVVEERYLGSLSCDEVEQLASIFGRLAG